MERKLEGGVGVDGGYLEEKLRGTGKTYAKRIGEKRRMRSGRRRWRWEKGGGEKELRLTRAIWSCAVFRKKIRAAPSAGLIKLRNREVWELVA